MNDRETLRYCFPYEGSFSPDIWKFNAWWNDRLCRDSPRTQRTQLDRLQVIFEPAFCLVTHEYMCVTHENGKFLKPRHDLIPLASSLERENKEILFLNSRSCFAIPPKKHNFPDMQILT